MRGRAAADSVGGRPERQVLTGIGPVTVRIPKLRDDPVAFRSDLAPSYVRKARSVEPMLPWLYLRGVASGEMQDALSMLPGGRAGCRNRW